MKKSLSILLMMALLASSAGCSSTNTTKSTTTSEKTTTKTKVKNTKLASGTYTTTIGGTEVTYNAAYIVDGIDATISSGTYKSATADQCVFLVVNGGSLTISDSTIDKSGDASTSDSTRTQDVSDTYNFYGINSAIVVVGENSSASINGCKINTSSEGSNAVFSTNTATIDIDDLTITTSANSSRGLDATYEGVITAKNVNISTKGSHCAAIATDRGNGTITLTGKNKLNTSGEGSPCIYSTGNITVSNATGSAAASETCVIEGKNSITLNKCKLSGNSTRGIMMYQSMSGDAADANASSTHSTLTINNSTITNKGSGAMIYITNTVAQITMTNTKLVNSTSTTLINAAAGNWGNSGSNGGTLTATFNKMTISGSVTTDSISSIAVNLNKKTTLTGSNSGNVSVKADSTSSQK